MTSPRILYFDIETFPLLAHVWNRFVDGPVIGIEREWTIASIAWTWDGSSRVYTLDCRDNIHDDVPLLVKLWELFDEADVIIGHNADRFDIRKVQARFLLEGFPPPSPFQTIDTLKVVRKHFNLTSNRLGDVTQALGLGGKVQTGGFDLWLGCLNGDERAWNKMARYNRQDVALLPLLYERLRPWMSNHPVLHNEGCPACGSTSGTRRGTRRTKAGAEYQQYQCNDCGSYYRDPVRLTASDQRGVTRS